MHNEYAYSTAERPPHSGLFYVTLQGNRNSFQDLTMRDLQRWLVCSCVILINTGVMTSQGISDNSLREARKLAKEILVFDGHIDLTYRIQGLEYPSETDRLQHALDAPNGDFTFAKATRGGLDGAFMAIFVDPKFQENGGALAEAETQIAFIETLIAKYPESFAGCLNPKDSGANKDKGVISLAMGLENGAPIFTLDDLQYFFDKGIRYVTLTHARDNHICDASYDHNHTWGGLSPFGKSLIPAMNRIGMLIDVSHVSDASFYQVLELSAVPVLATHSSCRHFTPGWERNMSDEMIQKLAAKGGVIMINFGSDFIDRSTTRMRKQQMADLDTLIRKAQVERGSDEETRLRREFWSANERPFASVEQVADHIDHVVKLVGIDHVGLGSDFDGVGNTLPKGLKDCSDLPNLFAVLLAKGYTHKDISKLASENVFRVWREVLEYAESCQ